MATWTRATLNATYPNITSLAQSKNTGQYMLAITTGTITSSGDFKGRIFKSDDYGANWTLLQDLFPIPTNGATNSSHLNYATMEAELYQPEANLRYGGCVFYACAVSDDGKYQMFGQIASNGATRGMWYSTNYGNQTPGGPADENWKYVLNGAPMNGGAYPNGLFYARYSPGAYPAATALTQTFTHFTGLTPATGIFNSLGNIIGNNHIYALPALYDNNFTTISRNVIYYIGSGNLYKNTNAGTSVLINPLDWPVSTTPGGGVAVSPDSNIVVAARFVSPNGGLWLSNNGGSTWTKKLINGISNVNINAVDMSQDGKYIVTSAIGGGNLRFYLSQDFGETWTFNDVSIIGNLLRLDITNNGKRVVGAAMKSAIPQYDQPYTTGYFNYIGPLTAAEQFAAGKTVAELIALSYSHSDIMGAGYTLSQLIDGGIPLTSLRTVYTISQLRDAGVTISQLRSAGVTISQLLAANVPISELLAANITISELLAAGATISQLVAGGVPFSQLVNYAQWLDLSATSNIFNRTYVNNFIDLSGHLLIRNNGALTVGGDVSFNYVTLNGTKYVANDIAVTSRLFIGNDISINGNMSVGGDVSIINQFSGNFANNLIPTTAIINYPSSGGNVVIPGNVRIAGDVSFNGTTVDLTANTVLQVDDYITFNDGSIMARHDDLKSRMFDMSASSVTTTTVTGVAQGQRILCSSDGKYVAINMGGLTYGATNYTQSSTGIDISQDYGATFTRKYLNDPANGTTPLYRPYSCLSISLTGQFMICCSYGATGHNVSDNVIGFSNNYGATWSSAYLKDLIGTGTEVMYIRGVAISSDGATMIIDVFRNSNMHMYKTTSKSLSGFTLINNRGTAYFAENTLKLIQAGGVEYIVAQSLDNNDQGRLVIYYLSSGTNLHTSTINYNGSTDVSVPRNAINCIITGPAGQISRVDCREDFVYNQPNVTDISNNYTQPSATRLSSVQSPLGKHILIGPFINSSYNSPDIKDATRLRYSTNGGYTFKTVSGLVSNTFTAIKSVAISDRGHMYILDDIGSGNLTYVAAKFELMRDVIFKSVVVNGAATVAGTITATSDYRIKQNVSNLNNNDTIDDLVPIQYNNILSGKHEFGLFAHELQSIYPELVEGEKDGAEYQRVDYNGLIGVLVKEVQDLKKRVAVIKK